MKKIVSYLMVFILALAVVSPASASYFSFKKERKAVPTWVKEYKPYKGIRLPKDPSIRY